jgi:hypothetical protein
MLFNGPAGFDGPLRLVPGLGASLTRSVAPRALRRPGAV